LEQLTIKTILSIEEILEKSTIKGKFKPELFLPILKDLGFYTCAYYEAVSNIASEDYELYLSAICCDDNQEKFIGDSVKFQNTSLSRNGEKKPQLQDARDCYQTEQLKTHTDKLLITDKCRIHIPIFSKNELIGALTCSWKGEVSLSEEDINMFSMLSKILSIHWEQSNENLSDLLFGKIKNTLANKSFEESKVQDILEMATQLVGESFNAEVVALFEYNWYSDRLSKINEWNVFSNHSKYLNEEYQSGQFLTGKAWQNIDYRCIVNFREFKETYKEDINIESLGYHSELLCTITTLLYYPFGSKSKYLFRLINRKNNKVTFPFLHSHTIVLNLVLTNLGILLDDMIDAQRMNHLQNVSKSAISNISFINKTLSSIHKALNIEGVSHLGMMAYAGNDIHFSHKYFSKNEYLKSIQSHCSWEEDKFYKKCIEIENISILKLTDFPEINKINHLLYRLKKDFITCVVIVPFEAYQINGFLIIIPPENTNYSYKLAMGRLPSFHKKSLQTYAGLIAGCIESSNSYLTSENARRLVGQIGHEVASPVAELGQTAIMTSDYAIDVLSLLAKGAKRSSLKKYQKELDDYAKEADIQMEQIQRLMDVAVDMAQETKGQVSATYKKFNLYKILISASKEASKDGYIDKNGKSREIKFVFNKAAKSMTLYIGDQYLIKKSFVNVFRNAIKYSMPTSSNRYEPIIIEILGNPQENMFNLQIINWGNPLKSDKIDIIFNAFERGDPYDKFKARRGMGLGLYIARKFLDVHGGNIFCKDSFPTLDDPSRKNIEGWKTTFELRLPLGLKEGVTNA